MERRIESLERQMSAVGCPTCRDWPPLVIQSDDAEPDHPERCPECDRDATHVIRFIERADGPQ